MYKFLNNQKGAIESTLMTIVGLFLVTTLMFIVPLMAVSERNNDIAQAAAQTAVADFVNNAANAGAIIPTEYEALLSELNSTGNTFEITIEVQHLDENFGKKNNTTSGNLIGENERYSTFTTEILDYMYPDDINNMIRNYPLKKGDMIIVTVKNTNETLATQLRRFAYRVTGKGTYEIVTSASAMVINDGKIRN